tara:strand:- start:646 stop:2436 length:1791 start_codon:yes stop_codon:yes gene_type:complete
MAQHDYVIDNSTGANVRADINNVLQAIVTNNSTSDIANLPATFPSMLVADANAGIMKLRNTSNNAFVNLFTLAGGIDVDAASTFSEDVTFEGATSGKNIVFDRSDNALEFNDDAKATFGTGADCSITHSGADFAITNAVGNLNILCNSSQAIQLRHGSENMVRAVTDGTVELYYDNSPKLETSSVGIIVTGQMYSNSAQIVGAAGGDAVLGLFSDAGSQAADKVRIRQTHVGNSFLIESFANGSTYQSILKGTDARAIELHYQGSKKLETTSDGVKVGSVTIDSSFNFIGLPDNGQLRFGAGEDLRIFHSGSVSRIQDVGTGQLEITTDGSSIDLNKGLTEYMGRFKTDGAVELYYDNGKKLSTTSNGIKLDDDTRIGIGNGEDLQLIHNGTRSEITNGAGDLVIQTSENNKLLLRAQTGESHFIGYHDAQVEIYFNGSKKFHTLSTGCYITGSLSIAGQCLPSQDHSGLNLGSSTLRWTTVFAANGSINTSDRNEKNTIVESDLGLNFINNLKPVSFKWNKDDGRTYYGLIAQDIEETITSLGKTVTDFGGIHKEDNSPMGLNYTQLLSPLIKAVQELSAEVKTLKTKVAALEAA